MGGKRSFEARRGSALLAEYLMEDEEEDWFRDSFHDDDDNDDDPFQYDNDGDLEGISLHHGRPRLAVDLMEMISNKESRQKKEIKQKTYATMAHAKSSSRHDDDDKLLISSLSFRATTTRRCRERSHSLSFKTNNYEEKSSIGTRGRRLSLDAVSGDSSRRTDTSPEKRSLVGTRGPVSALCVKELLLPPVRLSVVGPDPSASVCVISKTRRAGALVVWSLPGGKISTLAGPLKVAPLFGCGETRQEQWDVALLMESKLREMINACIPRNASSSPWKIFFDLSSALGNGYGECVALLESCIPRAKECRGSLRLITSACTMNNMTVGKILDRYDLFKICHGIENDELIPTTMIMKKTADDAFLTTTTNRENESEGERAEGETDHDICLVCYDSKPDDMVRLLSCGHSACLDCWRTYMRVAAQSGDHHLRCPAFKCPTRLGWEDCSHILFSRTKQEGDFEEGDGDDADECHDEHRLSNLASYLSKIFRFTLERCGMKPKGGQGQIPRFCSSNSCNRLLVLGDRDENRKIRQPPGWNLLVCACAAGPILCGNCDCTSHPGISCKQQKEFQSETGRLRAEIANIEWVMKNSRPCPECRFPIQRDGGCNHVRCQKCQYYFCWQCGGRGNDCMAFYCANESRYWHEDPDHNGSDEDNKLLRYRAYRTTEFRLKKLQRELENHDRYADRPHEREAALLEVQIQQVMLWIHGVNLAKVVNENKAKKDFGKASLHRLEILTTALSLRNARLCDSGDSKAHTIHPEQFATGAPVDSSKKGYISRRKLQVKEAKKEKFIASSENVFHDLVMQKEVADLCRMKDSKFATAVRDGIREGVKSLQSSMDSKSKRSKDGGQGKSQLSATAAAAALATAPLNERRDRSHDPWKNGWKKNKEGEREDQSFRHGRLKSSKALLASRRAHAIDRSEFMMCEGTSA